MGNCLVALGLKKLKSYNEMGIDHGPVKLLLVGLDNSGKTTAAKGIIGDSIENVAPTVGFSPEVLEYRGCEITIYDLGGGSQFRAVWPNYFTEVHGVIFVIDSSDKTRIEECHNVLEELLSHKKISGKPALVLANKQDVEGALDEIDLVETLKIEQIVNKYKCPTRVEMCTATAITKKKPDKPIADGFRWLLDTIVIHYQNLSSRVSVDVKEEQQRRMEEMERRNEKIKRLREERERDELQREAQLSTYQCQRRDSDVIVHKQGIEAAPRSDVPEEASGPSVEPLCGPTSSHESAPSPKSSSEAQELEELGFDSSLNSLRSSSASSSSSFSSHVPSRAAQSGGLECKSPRLIQVHPPPAQVFEEGDSIGMTNNAPQPELPLDLESEDGVPRTSECVPIDSDEEEPFDPAVEDGRRECGADWGALMEPTTKTSIAGIKEQIELEVIMTRKPKRKNFLKRFHKTAPIKSATMAEGLFVAQEASLNIPSGRIP